MNRLRVCITALCFAWFLFGCGTFGGGDKPDETAAEIRQVPGKAEYVIFGPHLLRGGLAITGLPEGASEEVEAAARAGTYSGPVVWTLQGQFTFGTDAHQVLEPEVTVGKSQPEQVEILLTVIPPAEEFVGIMMTRKRVQKEFTATPQARFKVRVVEKKQ